MHRARDLEFGTQTHRDNTSKTGEEKFRKGAPPSSHDPDKFWHTPKISPKCVELETWNFADRCTGAISQKRQRNIKRSHDPYKFLGRQARPRLGPCT